MVYFGNFFVSILTSSGTKVKAYVKYCTLSTSQLIYPVLAEYLTNPLASSSVVSAREGRPNRTDLTCLFIQFCAMPPSRPHSAQHTRESAFLDQPTWWFFLDLRRFLQVYVIKPFTLLLWKKIAKLVDCKLQKWNILYYYIYLRT